MELDHFNPLEEAIDTGQMSVFEHGWHTVGYADLGVDNEHPDYEDEQQLRRLMEETDSIWVCSEDRICEEVLEGLHQDWDDLAGSEITEMFFEWVDWDSLVEHTIRHSYRAVRTEHNGVWYAYVHQ